MDKKDFLSGFSGGNKPKPIGSSQTDDVVEKKAPNESIAANKKLADDIVAKEKLDATTSSASKAPQIKATGSQSAATRPAQSSSAIIKAPEHVVTTDQDFHKRKLIKQGMWGGVGIVIAIIIFFIFRMLNTIEVPNFVNRDIDDVAIRSFQIENVPFSITEVHSLYEAGRIIDQSPEAGVSINSRRAISVTVSLGPDLNEVIELPDFYDMTRAQIGTWRDQYQMRSIRFEEENHAEIPQNHVIRVEYPATSDPAHFRRSDSVIIFVSRGPSTVQVGNMVGNTREQVDTFIENNPGISVELEFVAHSTIAHGNVLAQSVSPGTRLALGETLVLTLSAGEPVEVPDFSNMRRIEVEALAALMDDLHINIIDQFQETIRYRDFVEQSVEAGEMLIADRPSVDVIFSLGRPWIDKWATVQNVESNVADMNDQGANLTVNIVDVDSYLPRGTVVEQSHYDQRVSLTTTITVSASRGNLDEPDFDPVTVPDFSGMRRSEVSRLADETNDLTIRIADWYDDGARLGQFVNQSHAPGTVLQVANPTVTVNFSAGLPWIDEWSTVQNFEADILDFNDRGAAFTFEIIHVNHYERRGNIVRQSHFNQQVALDTHIVVHVSRGNMSPPEDVPELPELPNLPEPPEPPTEPTEPPAPTFIISANCNGIIVDGEHLPLDPDDDDDDSIITIDIHGVIRIALPAGTTRNIVAVNVPNNWIFTFEGTVADGLYVVIIPSWCPA